MSQLRNKYQLPAQGTASGCGCAGADQTPNVPRQPLRENYSSMRGGQDQGMGMECTFPGHPPERVYCQAAPFSQVNGQQYFALHHAYGQSRPKY